MNQREQQFLKSFIAWCNKRQVPFGSELSTLKETAERILVENTPIGGIRMNDCNISWQPTTGDMKKYDEQTPDA